MVSLILHRTSTPRTTLRNKSVATKAVSVVEVTTSIVLVLTNVNIVLGYRFMISFGNQSIVQFHAGTRENAVDIECSLRSYY